jgi:uncharacterized protein
MKERIIGFDLARAYAIFGMYIVNFNIVFGDYKDNSLSAQFLSLFSGNSSTIFVMLAGMGIALMSNKVKPYTVEEKKRLRNVVNKRGLLLCLWWPADILHFYGGYMHIAALLLFVDKKYYLYVGTSAIIVFHLLLLIIPYETGWNFDTLQYNDFWTLSGFFRNTLYNGWNSIFPWLAYFTTGMYLGKLNWQLPKTQKKIFSIGLLTYLSIALIQFVSNRTNLNANIKLYINADYLPPFLPFVLSTIGFGFMIISVFIYVSKFVNQNKLAKNIAHTGQMTLTHYISHLTIGITLLTLITGNDFEAKVNNENPLHPLLIFAFSFSYFMLSYWFSKLWSMKFRNGPLETIMRKISG